MHKFIPLNKNISFARRRLNENSNLKRNFPIRFPSEDKVSIVGLTGVDLNSEENF